jgi:general stress protein CsbA
VEQITTKKIVLASVFLFALVILTAVVQIKVHFSTYIALVIMLIGTIVAAGFLNGAQD